MQTTGYIANSVGVYLLALCVFVKGNFGPDSKVHAKEYCLYDKFNATCGSNQVIVMETARFGRLYIGRCAPQNYSIGCRADVMPYMDAQCSGLRKCQVEVVEFGKQGIRPCTEGVTSFFEGAYRCIEVVQGEFHDCHVKKQLTVTSPRGYISSLNEEDRSYGSRCPWVIRVNPGQKINITLLYFEYNAPSLDTSDNFPPRSLGQSSTFCRRLAIISERGKQHDVCGGREREKNVFLSQGNQVEIEMVQGRNKENVPHFLLQYHAVGCSSPPNIRGAHVERDGDTVRITCNVTGDTWYMRCDSGVWNGPHPTNCSYLAGGHGVAGEYDWTSPYGLLIVVGLGVVIGIFIGLVLLAMVMMWMRRRRRHESGHDPRYSEPDPTASQDLVDAYFQRDPYKMGQYTDIWRGQMGQPPPPGSIQHLPQDKSLAGPPSSGYRTMSVDSASLLHGHDVICTTPGSPGKSSHLYESPKFKRREYYSQSSMT